MQKKINAAPSGLGFFVSPVPRINALGYFHTALSALKNSSAFQ